MRGGKGARGRLTQVGLLSGYPHPPRPPLQSLPGLLQSEAPTSKSAGGSQEMLRVLVWPRSTEPLEGSMAKPLCCRDARLSRLKSTVCEQCSCWCLAGKAWAEGAQLHLPSQPDQQAPAPHAGRGHEGRAAQQGCWAGDWRSSGGSPSLRTAGWSGCSPPAAPGWQGGLACLCPAARSPGSPGWASAPPVLGWRRWLGAGGDRGGAPLRVTAPGG